MFQLHPQLQADCYILGKFTRTHVLLHKNALIPWFILVPETEDMDLLDLDSQDLGIVLAECQRLSQFLKVDLAYKKVNFASIGNLVPQLHLHTIGRSTDDCCWPAPIWGNLSESLSYSEEKVKNIVSILAEKYKMTPSLEQEFKGKQY